MTTSMLELVDELLIAIIDHINDLAALHSLARTCHRLNALAEPAIYRDILLRGRNHTSALATSLVSRPERLQAIRSIEARPQYNHQECRLYVLESIIRRAPKLQQLTVESPFCNHVQYREATYGWEESMRALLRPICHFSIARLTSLTLHLSLEDKRYWPIDQSNAMLFAHPTLTSLKISCATLGDDLAPLLQDRPRTPLKQLILIECNVTQKAVGSILALPNALEHLSLGENCVHANSGRTEGSNSNNLFACEPHGWAGFLQDLQQQQHSLRRFGYATPGMSAPLLSALIPSENLHTLKGLSGFEKLTDISIEGCMPEFTQQLTSKPNAPPALQRLSFTQRGFTSYVGRGNSSGPSGSRGTIFPWLAAVCDAVPSLQLLEFISPTIFTDAIEQESDRVLQTLRGRGVQWKVYARKRRSDDTPWLGGVIPPFLFGEQHHVDVEVCSVADGRVVWDSGDRKAPASNALVYA